MNYTRLGKSDLRASVVGQGGGQFGASSWGYGKLFQAADVLRVIRREIELGVNLFDTAEFYGEGLSESLLGEALSGYPRDDYIVVSKVAPWNLSYNGVVRAAERSLSRLGTKVIDLYLVHYPNPFAPMKQTFRALEDLVRRGRIRYFGVSNFSPLQLKWAQESLTKYELVANEIEYSLLSRRSERATIPYCIAHDIAVISYSPLAGGVLSGRFSEGNVPRDKARAFNFLATHSSLSRARGVLEVLKEIAHDRGLTVPQVAIAWILSHRTAVPIPTALNVGEAEQNAAAADIALTRDELSRIEKNAFDIGTMKYYLDHYAVRPAAWAKLAAMHYSSLLAG